MKIDAYNFSEMLKMLKKLTLFNSFFIFTLLSTLPVQAQCPDVEFESSNPPIPASGTFEPGTAVELCFDVTYVAGADWISAVVFDLPDGWDTDDLSNNPPPPPPSCGGDWVWFDSNPCGCTLPVDGPGWYYDSGVVGPLDGDPCNDWGASCLSGSASGFTYCVDLTLDADCGGPGNPYDGQLLAPTIVLYGDQEVGNWSGGPCSSDPPCPAPQVTLDFPVTLDCCDAESGTPPAAPVNICGDTPFDLLTLLGAPIDAGGTWTGPPGWTAPPPGTMNATFTPSSTDPALSDPPGDYTYEVTGTDGCLKSSTITMQFIDLGLQATNSVCTDDPESLFDLWLNPNFTLPPGGTWTFEDGTVIPGATINSSTNVSGIYTYTFTDAAGCLTTISMQLNIAPGGGAGFPANNISVCVLDPPFLPYDSLLGVPASLSGSWIYYDDSDGLLLFSGAGNSTNWELNPSDYNAGNPMEDGYVAYFSNDPACGFSIDTIFIDVGEVFDPGLFTNATICEGDGPTVLESLLDGTPSPGGNWEDVNGVAVSNPLDPLTVAPDSTYTLIYSGGMTGTACANSQVLQLTVLSNNANAGCPTVINICESQPPINMTDTLLCDPQPNGVWTGPPGFGGGNFFIPGTSPEGVYTYTLNSACGSDSNTLTISVTDQADAGTDGTLDICPSDVNIPLSDGLGGTPDGAGSWTLNGVNVNPATVSGATVTDGDVYVYSVGSGTCNATAEVTINLLTVASAGSDVSITVCESDMIINMFDSIPDGPLGPPDVGGSWIPSGPLFDPGNSSEGAYIYAISNPGCGTSTATVTVDIQELPDAGQNTAVTVCESLGSIDLTGELNGTPESGGSWTEVGTGTPVSNPYNLTGNCNSTLSFEYTIDDGVCAASSILDLTIACPPEAGPDVTEILCADNSTFDLFTILDTSADTDGDFINDATSAIVTNGLITLNTAAAGTYTYTADGAPCAIDEAIYTIDLQIPISVTVDAQCTAAQDEYIVTITASGGDGNYSISGIGGPPFVGNVFESDPIAVGQQYSFTISDTGPCADFVQGPTPGPNCACPADGEFVPTDVTICEGGTADIELNFPAGTGPFAIEYTDGTNTFIEPGPLVSGDAIQVSPLVSTTYELTVVSDQNCPSIVSDLVNVNVETPPNAGPDLVFDLCGSGGNLILDQQIDSGADQIGSFEDSGGNTLTTIPQSPAGSGVYTYIVPGSQCPADDASYTFNFDDPISVNVVSAVCNSAQTDYVVTLNITGGDGNYTVTGLIEDSFIGNTFVSQEITAGTSYSYTVSDGGPCPDVTAGPIDSPDCACPAAAEFVGGPITICEGETTDLELNFPGGTGPFYIDYTDGTNPVLNDGPFDSGDFIQVSPTVTTTYTLTGIEDAFCNTTASGSITVNVETPPNAGPDVDETFCATSANYNLNNLVDGGNADTGGDFYDSGNNQIIGNTIILNSSASDVYTYEVEGSVCPDDQALYTITINDEINISNVLVQCNQGQTGYVVSFDIEGGDGNYTVTEAGGVQGTLTPGSITSYESELIPNDTNYNFTISDGSPCSDQVVSGVDPDCDCPAAASFSGTTSICDGDCTDLTFDLDGDGPWDVVYENSSDPGNPITLTDISNGHVVTVCPLVTTTYTILSVNDINCDGLVTGQPVTVTVDAPLSVTTPVETCDDVNENYIVEFTVSGGIPGTYLVNPAGASFASGDFESNEISSGDAYSFTVSDAGACPSITVDGQFQCACITEAGSIASGLIETCENEELVVPFNNDENLDGNDGYQFVLHDGSESEIGAIIDRFNSPVIAIPEEIEFGVTYYITGIAGNTDVFGDVLLSDDCTDQTNGIPVIFNELPAANISGFGTVCPGESVEITVSLSGTAPWTFEYAIDGNPQTPIVSSDPMYTFDATDPGNYTLLSVSDANNCDGSFAGLVQVQNFPAPTAAVSGNGDVCENSGDGPVINLTGQAPWTFTYSIDGEEAVNPITTFNSQYTIPADEDGIYTLTSLSDANCIGTSTGSLDVTILTAPTALISGGGTVCEGDELNFDIEFTGASPWTVTYTIDGIPQQSITSDSPSYSFSSGENGDYVITQVNDLNCDGEALESDAELIVNPLPTAEVLSNQDQICIGQELELIYDLQGTPPFTMTYLLDEDTVTLTGLTSDYLEVMQPTEPVFTQVLYVEDSSNPVCTNTPNNSRFIPVGELPDAPVLDDDTICSDVGSISIGVEGAAGLDYTWSPEGRLSDPKDPNPTFSLGDDDLVPIIRTYTYVLTASNGDCVADDTLTITVDPGPRARFDFNPRPVNSEDTKVLFENLSSSGDEALYFWQFDSLDTSQEFNPVYEFPGGVLANYTVILTAIDPTTGCIDEWSDIVEVKPEMLVYVPSAFTPDNDGLNDLWRPVLSNIDGDDYLLTVYDRHGMKVFETRDPDKAWNGSLMGDDYYVKTGVYVWQIETKNPLSQEKVDFKGTVTVVR